MEKIRKLYEKVRTFLKEVKVEMKKVTWPTREDLTTYTAVVLIVVVIVAIYIGVVDKILGFFLKVFLHI